VFALWQTAPATFDLNTQLPITLLIKNEFSVNKMQLLYPLAAEKWGGAIILITPSFYNTIGARLLGRVRLLG